LVALNRYWKFSGDELSLPACCSVLFRLLGLSGLVAVMALTSKILHEQCGYSGNVLLSYLICSSASFLLSLILDIAIIILSLRGSIIETEERSNMTNFLFIRALVGVFQCFTSTLFAIFLVIHSVLNYSHESFPCDNSFDGYNRLYNKLYYFFLIFSQSVDLSALICCCYWFSTPKEAINSSDNFYNELPTPTFLSTKNNITNCSPLFRYTSMNSIEPINTSSTPSKRKYRSRKVVSQWAQCCKRAMRSFQLCSCNTFGGQKIADNESAFEEVAKVLTTFFHHDGFLDVVPSDVVAGIILVRLQQRHNRKKRKQNVDIEEARADRSFDSSDDILSLSSSSYEDFPPSSYHTHILPTNTINTTINTIKATQYHSVEMIPWFPSFSQPHDQIFLLSDLARYSTFSVAVYTHMLAIYMNPCYSFYGILTSTCGRCWQHVWRHVTSVIGMKWLKPSDDLNTTSNNNRDYLPENVAGDNPMGLNYAGLSVVTKQLKDSELVYGSFQNDVDIKPYAVFLDHEKAAVVIAIRGTLSIEDCITDVLCHSEELRGLSDEWGYPGTGRWAHSGMLKAALTIRQELHSSGLLESIFSAQDSSYRKSGSAGYNARTPLKRHAADLSGYRLVLTGHSLGAGTAVLLSLLLLHKYPHLHCYTFGAPPVLDKVTAEECKPFVTSVVLGNDLVSRMSFLSLNTLRNDILDCISRARVNKMCVMQAIFRDFDIDDLMYRAGQEPPSQFKQNVAAFKAEIQSRIEVAHIVPLFLPGRIIFLAKKAKVPKECCSRNETSHILQEKDLSAFTDIEVSSSMAMDHFPDRYFNEIQKLFKSALQSCNTV